MLLTGCNGNTSSSTTFDTNDASSLSESVLTTNSNTVSLTSYTDTSISSLTTSEESNTEDVDTSSSSNKGITYESDDGSSWGQISYF